jgi:peroxiredoxin
MPSRFHNGEVFPDLTVDVVGGQTLRLPRDLAESYAVVLIYRGSWCPYCSAQLAAFARAHERLAAAGAGRAGPARRSWREPLPCGQHPTVPG